MKVHSIPQVFFETASSEFIQILRHCLVLSKVTCLYSLAQTLYTLEKKSPK